MKFSGFIWLRWQQVEKDGGTRDPKKFNGLVWLRWQQVEKDEGTRDPLKFSGFIWPAAILAGQNL
jgi:hypothetical protein